MEEQNQNTIQTQGSTPNPENASLVETGVKTCLSTLQKRTGKTREHYLQQKNQQFAYFRINKEDAAKLESMQFNIYDFISASFSFSQPKKELAIGVLNALKAKPTAFSELVIQLNAKKSSLFLVCLSLERAGLIERKGKGEPYQLVTNFSGILASYANWWKFWAEH